MGQLVAAVLTINDGLTREARLSISPTVLYYEGNVQIVAVGKLIGNGQAQVVMETERFACSQKANCVY